MTFLKLLDEYTLSMYLDHNSAIASFVQLQFLRQKVLEVSNMQIYDPSMEILCSVKI
jgi:hypothetical protein